MLEYSLYARVTGEVAEHLLLPLVLCSPEDTESTRWGIRAGGSFWSLHVPFPHPQGLWLTTVGSLHFNANQGGTFKRHSVNLTLQVGSDLKHFFSAQSRSVCDCLAMVSSFSW